MLHFRCYRCWTFHIDNAIRYGEAFGRVIDQ